MLFLKKQASIGEVFGKKKKKRGVDVDVDLID